jgi:hypothetical protein
MFTFLLGKPEKHKFASAIIKAARRAGQERELHYDQDRFRLVIGDAQSGSQFNLQNVYEEYLSAGFFQRRMLLGRYVQLIAGFQIDPIPGTFREAQGQLLPRVREDSYLGMMKLYFEVEGLKFPEPIQRALAEHLTVELVYDLPHAITTIRSETLAEWGVGPDLALDVAFGNLQHGSAPRFESPARGVYVSAWKDNHDASRLVLLDLIRELEVRGEHVAMVPHRDLLIVTGSEDVPGLERMAALSEAALSGARFMSAIPVCLQWDRWIPFRLPEDHRLRGRFELLRAHTLLRDYGEQGRLLEQLHEKTGEDIFVATYSATQDEKTGQIRSYCVWSKGVRALLPRAETVYFFDGERPEAERIVGAPWKRVQELAGSLMIEQAISPTRYLVQEFPTREMLAKMAG